MGNFARQIIQWAQTESDPYWDNVVLLTKMDVTTPIDLSQSGHTLSKGAGASVDASIKKFGVASIDMANSSTGYVDGGDHVDWELGDGDFTLECWVNWDLAPSTDDSILSQYNNSTNERSWFLTWTNASTALQFIWSTDGTGGTTTSRTDATWTPTADTWYHIAVSRNGPNLRIFRDGVQNSETFNIGTAVLHNSAMTMRIGNKGGTSAPIDGWIDEVRITKGVGRYTEDFTPQVAEYPIVRTTIEYTDPYWENVIFQTDMETTDIPVDNSGRGHVLTLGSGTALTTATNKFKFGATAIDTDATSNGYMNIPDSADFDLADNKYTIEGWVNFETAPGASDDCGLVSQWDETGSQRGWLFALENQNLIFEHSTNGTAVTTKTSAWTPSADTWYHFAAARDGTNLRFFINGTQVGSATADTATYHNSTAAIRVGDPVDWDQGKVQAYFDGVRLTKGVARYTADFAPPVRAFPTVGCDPHFHKVTALVPLNEIAGSYRDKSLGDKGISNDTGVTTEETVLLFDDRSADVDATDDGMIVVGDAYWDSVVLLTHMDHTTPIDVSQAGHTITVQAGATRDTTNKKFGASSFAFDGGSTANMTIPDHANWSLGGDFTIECWVYWASDPTTGNDIFVSHYQPVSDQREWYFGLRNNFLRFTFSTDGTSGTLNDITEVWNPAATTWYHCAVSRIGNDFHLFVDGVLLGVTNNSSTPFASSTSVLEIGDEASETLTHGGNIDGIRITKSIGRYSESFDVPTRPFSSAAVIPTTGEFTIEGWARWETDPTTSASILASQWNESEDERGWQLYLNNNQLRFSYSTDGAVGTVTNTDKAFNPAADTWYHVAIGRDSSDDMRWFIDGVQIGSTSNVTATFHDSSAIVALGETEDHVTGSTQIYLADWRFTSEHARYVADFIPPQKRLPTQTMQPTDIEGADCLVWFDGYDAKHHFRDAAGDVYQLHDRTNQGRHVIQTTPSDGPSWVEGGSPLNANNGFSFDNTEWMWRDQEDWMHPVNITMFAVYSPNALTSTHFIWGVPYDGDTAWDTPFVAWMLGHLNDDQRFFMNENSTLNNWTEIINRSADVAEVQAMRWDGAVADTWWNLTVGAQQNFTDGDIEYGSPLPPLVIGARAEDSGARGEFADGDAGEMFSFGIALGDDAVLLLNNYLVSKWGI